MGLFGLLDIGNVGPNTLPRPLAVSDLTHFSNGDAYQATEIQHFYHRVRSDMIAKTIDG